MSPSKATRFRIRDLNDAARAAGPGGGAQWFFTPGISELGPLFLVETLRTIQRFDAFTEDNDPYGEHDFGAADIAGSRVFWKIDYYDPTMSFCSSDPGDAALTRRVITVMLASEY